MAPIRRSTRKSTGSELSLQEVDRKYNEIRQGPQIKREETLALIHQFFHSDDVEIRAKTVSLLCPVSKRRIQDAVRGSQCKHIECFDLRSYLEYHTNLVYWECPFTFCREQVGCEQLRVDEYTSNVLHDLDVSVLAVEVFSDGTFQAVQGTTPAAVMTIKDEGPYAGEPLVEEAEIKLEKESPDDNEPPTVSTGNAATTRTPGRASTISSGVNLFECDQCHARLSNKSALEVHCRLHTGERPFKCRHCEKSFVTGSQRKAHERIHTGEKPFKCPQCPKRFTQSCAIPRHLLTHTEQRPFACTVCGQRFKAQKSLANHQLLHEGN